MSCKFYVFSEEKERGLSRSLIFLCEKFRLGGTSQFAERGGNGKAGGADSGEKAAENPHHQSKNNSLGEQQGSDLEGESKIGERLKIDGAGGQAV